MAQARPKKKTPLAWYAIRSIFLFRKKPDGTNVFEERIVVFSARNADVAFDKAARESKRYADTLGLAVHPMRDSYEVDAAALTDGHEVWSKLYESRKSLNAFYTSRYEKSEYHPE